MTLNLSKSLLLTKSNLIHLRSLNILVEQSQLNSLFSIFFNKKKLKKKKILPLSLPLNLIALTRKRKRKKSHLSSGSLNSIIFKNPLHLPLPPARHPSWWLSATSSFWRYVGCFLYLYLSVCCLFACFFFHYITTSYPIPSICIYQSSNSIRTGGGTIDAIDGLPSFSRHKILSRRLTSNDTVFFFLGGGVLLYLSFASISMDGWLVWISITSSLFLWFVTLLLPSSSTS